MKWVLELERSDKTPCMSTALILIDGLLLTLMERVQVRDLGTRLHAFAEGCISLVDGTETDIAGLIVSSCSFFLINFICGSDLNVLRLDDYIMDIRGLLLDPHGTSDVSFSVENQIVHAHSAVLFARCPMLYEKVSAEGRFQEQAQGFHRRIAHVRVHDFSFEAFFDFMMYVYTGTLQFSDKYMLDVWVLAKTYSLKGKGKKKICMHIFFLKKKTLPVMSFFPIFPLRSRRSSFGFFSFFS